MAESHNTDKVEVANNLAETKQPAATDDLACVAVVFVSGCAVMSFDAHSAAGKCQNASV